MLSCTGVEIIESLVVVCVCASLIHSGILCLSVVISDLPRCTVSTTG